MRIFLKIFVFLLILDCEGRLSASESFSGQNQNLLYRVHVDLAYFDLWNGWGGGKKENTSSSPNPSAVDTPQYSTLGLARSAFELDLRAIKDLELELVFRPESTNSQGLTELDTRMGTVIESRPSIHLLDEYRFIYRTSQSTVSVGVLKTVLTDLRTIPDYLAFGLRVQGPEKSFALSLHAPRLWSNAASENEQKFGLSTIVLSGNDDRHDGRRTIDAGGSTPAKQTAYWGGSLGLSWSLGEQTSVQLQGVLLEDRAGDLKSRGQWYQLGLRRVSQAFDHGRGILVLEVRQLRKSYELDTETSISDETLSSVGITGSFDRKSGDAPFIGAWLGSGLIHPTGIQSKSVSAKGLQCLIGWQWTWSESSNFSLMGAREWRKDGTVDGRLEGGFGPTGDKRSIITRYGAVFSYELGGKL